ncbi:TIGR02221 family CRISPR-associated protein [Aphanizomenon flos-aquae NRERC-008]|uniref:TIGR02221 family CRISPR-associated protein n=1 Tax=Aphanizomenon flos-aquae FACHB-1249 TaxID=2692889 RepID=A0ABR8IQ14_APHFL|nr:MULTISPECIES: TIGR02221 family CRISPR-associated protein [Aphanizomenon]MCE2905288.1 TIGR02221 family CRISPR-associated protein [Anabaena sp. CoA2_C59]MDJ0506053.1 TIGR02221 family CRISPR-associated protein [Nostocales cyanobacterium LE14-WE12]MBD2389277.1 TIGR02221 family CRISPR-associated protein [Aphanizomenon flos-aquae FACHB-1171]MBD2555348.1 TIGR02221 family CRISPR-associated protein [Aphanizomenon flos-aquae FACHB-1290]MBD2631521.1 TIGR02221 family CRISPR-associated protein [Aphanizo
MQLLTVLGTGRYEKTCYTWQEKQVETRYVAHALCEFFQPDQVTVLVTKEAKEAHWNTLQEILGDRFQSQDVLIPSGKVETEVWEIFDAVVNSVEPNAKVLFDITHAFRSIPLLVLLAAAFLQKARNVEIVGVYYGAFDANREQPPIFDLTPAIKLLDWLTATDKFLSTGSSVELGKLLSTIQKDFYRRGKQKTANVIPTKLKSFGDRIQALSRSIELIRPIDLITESAQLQNIPTSQLQEEVGAFAKPFELLLSQIQNDYSQFALNIDQSSPKEQLQKQFLLLRWYIAKNLSCQAILLGREWLISAICIADGTINYRDRIKREVIEKQLGQMIGANSNFNQEIVKYVTSTEKLGALWSTLTEYRNDIAHTQMRPTTISATTLEEYAQNKLVQGLSELLPDFTA